MEDLIYAYENLVESLKFLILSSDEQKKVLPPYTDMPFEVVDTYINAFILTPQLIDNERLTNEVVAHLIRIETDIRILENKLADPNISEEDFFTSRNWIKAQELAKKALLLMGESLDDLNIKFI